MEFSFFFLGDGQSQEPAVVIRTLENCHFCPELELSFQIGIDNLCVFTMNMPRFAYLQCLYVQGCVSLQAGRILNSFPT
jgi:hypothetical protein